MENCSLSLNDELRNTQNTHSCRQLYRCTFLLNHCTLIRNCPSLPPRVHFRCESARVHFRPSTNNNEDGTDGRTRGGGWGSRGTRNGFTTFRVRFDHLCVCPNLTCSHSPPRARCFVAHRRTSQSHSPEFEPHTKLKSPNKKNPSRRCVMAVALRHTLYTFCLLLKPHSHCWMRRHGDPYRCLRPTS